MLWTEKKHFCTQVLIVYLVMYLAPRAPVRTQHGAKKYETFLNVRNWGKKTRMRHEGEAWAIRPHQLTYQKAIDKCMTFIMSNFAESNFHGNNPAKEWVVSDLRSSSTPAVCFHPHLNIKYEQKICDQHERKYHTFQELCEAVITLVLRH